MPPRNPAAEWAHLAAWWSQHGSRYNMSALARAVGTNKSTLSILLRDPESPARKATPELLARLQSELAQTYAPNSPPAARL